MGDALCGPSNPLQSFQKHSSVDRSLQQDRFVSRQSPSQGFRTEPGPNAGILDPEFEAFQAGQAPQVGPQDAYHHPHEILRPPPAPSFQQQTGALGWASDFQKLHISQTPHAPAPQQHLQHPGASPWYQDFQRQHQTPTSSQQAFRPGYQPQFGGVSPFNVQRPPGFDTSTSNVDYSAETQTKGKEKWIESEEDKAAFDREFEAYASETFRQEAEQQKNATSAELGSLDILMKTRERATEIGRMEEELSALPQDSLPQEGELRNDHMDTIPEEQINQPRTEKIAPRETDDDLANTAAELLDRVSDNTTQKFQESSFLALMRRLRDREVRVEGDQMVEVEDGKPINEDDVAKAPMIPPAEQDHDHGRDVTMSGALPPSDGPNADGYGMHSNDPAALYGRHPVLDF